MKALPELRSPEAETWKASLTGRTQMRMGSGVCGHHCPSSSPGYGPGCLEYPGLNTHFAELSAPGHHLLHHLPAK